MKNKKNKKDPIITNSDIDESMISELKDLDSIASEIKSNSAATVRVI